MAKKSAPANGRQHRATFARDKRNGGYLIRIQGPHAERFSGRTVPVTRKDNSEEEQELESMIWTGPDAESGDKVALYKFVAKPREEEQDDVNF